MASALSPWGWCSWCPAGKGAPWGVVPLGDVSLRGAPRGWTLDPPGVHREAPLGRAPPGGEGGPAPGGLGCVPLGTRALPWHPLGGEACYAPGGLGQAVQHTCIRNY